MYEKIMSEVLSLDFEEFELKSELKPHRSEDGSGFEVVFRKGSTYYELKGFLLSEEYPNGIIFDDGFRIYPKGWMNVVNVSKNNYLFHMPLGCGYCHGMKLSQSALLNPRDCNQDLLVEARKAAKVSFVIDHVKGVVLRVEELFFEMDPFAIDFYKKKLIVVHNGERPLYSVLGGKWQVYNTDHKIHPVAEWWLSGCPGNLSFANG